MQNSGKIFQIPPKVYIETKNYLRIFLLYLENCLALEKPLEYDNMEEASIATLLTLNNVGLTLSCRRSLSEQINRLVSI